MHGPKPPMCLLSQLATRAASRQTITSTAWVETGTTLMQYNNHRLPYTATTTSLSSSQNPSTYRASVTLTASVTSLGAPAQGGNVAFYDGANLIGTVVLTNGAASLATSVLSVGSHSITATYSGSANYTSSTSSALVEAVSPPPLTITASSPTITYGESVPAITASYSGFVNGESASSFTTAPTCSAGIVTSAGTYTATCSGAVDGNYAITYVSGTLTVNTALLQSLQVPRQ